MKRYWSACLLLVVLAWLVPLPAQADCLVRSPATYAVGENIFKDSCDTAGNKPVTLGTLFSGEDQTNNLMQTSGGVVRQTTVTMGAAATANGTTAAFAVPTGIKTFYGQVVGTGSVLQTQTIYGDVDNDAANGIAVCVLVNSGTTRDQSFCRTDAPFLYYYVVTSATSGTSATGAVYVAY